MGRPPISRKVRIGVWTLVISVGGKAYAGEHCPHQRVTAAHQTFDGRFGDAVDIDGDWAIIGAWNHHHSPLVGGSAHIFQRTPSGWVEVQEVYASHGPSGQHFGRGVAIDGVRALVSATGHVHGAPEPSQGAVFVFELTERGWVEQHELLADDGDVGGALGGVVALSGDVAVVGSWSDDDAGSFAAGAVYVYRFIGRQWFQEQKLFASDPQFGAGFGISVSIGGDTILVGASGYDVPSSILETQCQPVVDPRITTGRDDGAAYIFRYDRAARRWVEQQQIIASDAAGMPGGDCGLEFGESVSLSGDTAIVGARGGSEGRGGAYIFRILNGVWAQEQKLVPPEPVPTAWGFGRSVSLDGDRAVVGAPASWSLGPGSYGAAYPYHFDGREWVQSQPVLVPLQWGVFGGSVAISGQRALVGAQGEFDFRGAAYFYMMTEDADLNCDGLVNGIDLGNLLANWSIPPDMPGCAGDAPCAADLNEDGLVNGLDLGILLANWTL